VSSETALAIAPAVKSGATSAVAIVEAALAEIAIAFILMSMVLATNASARLMRWTAVCAGLLMAVYIAFEAPLSGMSLNPALSVASALPSGVWRGIWIYLTAPPIGMLAAELHLRRGGKTPCAKLNPFTKRRCIFHCDFAGATNAPRSSTPPTSLCRMAERLRRRQDDASIARQADPSLPDHRDG
jgi:hypothetical protein